MISVCLKYTPVKDENDQGNECFSYLNNVSCALGNLSSLTLFSYA
jgi:hypothetical protein